MPDIRFGIAVLCADHAGRLLLGRRTTAPNPRLWGLPGGEVAFLESTREAARRVLAEKTGLRVELGGISASGEIIHPPLMHRVVLFFSATAFTSTPVAPDDDTKLQWLDRTQLAAAESAGELSETEATVLRTAGWLSPVGG